MIIARIESLILRNGLEDAIKRAKSYIAAGVDGIMIHRKEKPPDEILEVCERDEEVEDKGLFFIGKHTKSKNYRRMIMIDGTKLFFKKQTKNKVKFYFTTDIKQIQEYKKYFNRFNGR